VEEEALEEDFRFLDGINRITGIIRKKDLNSGVLKTGNALGLYKRTKTIMYIL